MAQPDTLPLASHQTTHCTWTTNPLQGHLAVVKELIADAGRRSCLKLMAKDGSTALHIAAAAGRAEVVQLLMDAGARPDAKDRVSCRLTSR